MDFKGLLRFVGTKSAYDSLDKTGKLVFAQITGATGDTAPYYLYANDKEFALNSYTQFKDLAGKVVYGATGDSYISVSGSTSLIITHNTSSVTATSYNGSVTSSNNSVTITVPTFTVDGAGHLTAAGTTSATIDASKLGLSGAMHFVGATTSKPTATTGHVSGDVIVVTGNGVDADKEFVFVGATGSAPATWVELGDETNYVKKTFQLKTDNSLTGGGVLSGTELTIGLSNATKTSLGKADSAIQGVTAGNTGVVVSVSGATATVSHATYTKADAAAVKVGRDEFGHVVTGDALAASDITISNVTGLSGTNVKEDFDQVVAKINTIDSKASKTYTATGSTSYIVVGSSTVGNTTTFTVGATLATTPSVSGIVGATAATATGIATDAYVKDYVTTALAWSVIG